MIYVSNHTVEPKNELYIDSNFPYNVVCEEYLIESWLHDKKLKPQDLRNADTIIAAAERIATEKKSTPANILAGIYSVLTGIGAGAAISAVSFLWIWGSPGVILAGIVGCVVSVCLAMQEYKDLTLTPNRLAQLMYRTATCRDRLQVLVDDLTATPEGNEDLIDMYNKTNSSKILGNKPKTNYTKADIPMLKKAIAEYDKCVTILNKAITKAYGGKRPTGNTTYESVLYEVSFDDMNIDVKQFQNPAQVANIIDRINKESGTPKDIIAANMSMKVITLLMGLLYGTAGVVISLPILGVCGALIALVGFVAASKTGTRRSQLVILKGRIAQERTELFNFIKFLNTPEKDLDTSDMDEEDYSTSDGNSYGMDTKNLSKFVKIDPKKIRNTKVSDVQKAIVALKKCEDMVDKAITKKPFDNHKNIMEQLVIEFEEIDTADTRIAYNEYMLMYEE